ncbi:hypothetical protein [Amycolatopsis sp. cmx-4-61]|uniref:hypothetical protein n=1 Tax=Amycolatopsis sp. cmx-4-61 TaxID=2790937 RepID=UPI00397900AC
MNDQPDIRNSAEDHYRHLATHPNTVPVASLHPHTVAGLRIDDLTLQIENDYRLVRICTVPEPYDCWPDVGKLLRERGEIVVPWHQARRPGYGLVLAASTRGIDDVRGPRLLVPHGGGFGQYRPWRPLFASGGCARVTGLDRDQLMRDGHVRADAIILTHVRELHLLEQTCREALPNAVVAGCIAFDRLVASLPYRLHYKGALNAADGRRTVVVTSTWSPRSAWGFDPKVFHEVVAAFPA